MGHLGKAYMAKADWNNALTTLDNAITCAPRMALAHEGKGYSLQKMKRYDDAVVAYQAAAKIKPSASINAAIASCRQNMDIVAHNQTMDQLEQAQSSAEAQEQARLAEEERKRLEWEERRKRDE
jgi:tetratricopeptide (TPR) repeat protein